MKSAREKDPCNSFNRVDKKDGESVKSGISVIDVNGVRIGGEEIIIMAGPCAVESLEQLTESAKFVRAYGGKILRGGAFKPRTSPFSFQGLGEEGLKMLQYASRETGLPVVTEVMDTRHVETVARYADILQIGSRNMQNYPLLKEVGRLRKPVLLKRGMMATIDEYLMASEYILTQGNENIILCERGIRTFETATRNTLDLSAVPVLKNANRMPVLVDPSHGTGHRWMVPAMARAAIAAGADGLLVEVHYQPESALCDGYQSISPEEFRNLMISLRKIALAIGRKIF